ncbi:MAG: ArsR/SmtB family transcription factor [Myxococcota bacterium]
MDLRRTHEFCRLLSDDTRLRLLVLLSEFNLTVGELTSLLGVAQSRVSTHLGRLREAGLVSATRGGQGSLYHLSEQAQAPEAAGLWRQVRGHLEDPLLEQDLQRARDLIEVRSQSEHWADTVAGRMERHYSPGRTWQSTARGLITLLELGDVLDVASGDGALVELVAKRARSIVGIDRSERVVNAARRRLSNMSNVSFVQGDMHELPFEASRFDTILLLHALTYAHDADRVVAECARVVRPGGSVVIQTLLRHQFFDHVKPFDHLNTGFEVDEVSSLIENAGLEILECGITHQEKRKPNFKIVTALGRRPKDI